MRAATFRTALLATAVAAAAPAARTARAQDEPAWPSPPHTVVFEPPPARSRPPDARPAGLAVAAAPAETPYGFYRDAEGRVMQTSFDLDRRLWLGIAFAPRRRPTGAVEPTAVAFEFGGAYEAGSDDGRTRHRLRFMSGEARLHPFGLDVTAFHYDLSHRYDTALLRVTTFFGEPERHDLFLNIGFFTEALHFDVAPRGLPGEYLLTLATAQATLDLWQSADLRSFVRLRVGPAVDLRIGPWGDEARLVGILPESTLEGRGAYKALGMHQQVSFRLTGQLYRSLTVGPLPIGSAWLASGDAAWETIFAAINDQPVSFRVAGQVGLRDPGAPLATGAEVRPDPSDLEWKATGAFRMSFFSPPIPPRR